MTTADARQILNGVSLGEELAKLAQRILDGVGGETDRLAIIGIRRRGVPMAERIAARIKELTGSAPATGALDITLYRDDLTLVADQPVVHGTEIEFAIDGLHEIGRAHV